MAPVVLRCRAGSIIPQEIAMAKAKKRVAVRKKNSKRGKASAKPARKRAAKRATPKKRNPRFSARA